MKKSIIIGLVTIGLATSTTISSFSSIVLADETTIPTTSIQTTKTSAQAQKIAETYKGTDLLSTNFNRSAMTDKEKAFFDDILEYEYTLAVNNGTTHNLTKEEYKKSLETLVYQLMSSNKINNSNPLLEKITARNDNPEHGLISTDTAASAFNVIIDTIIFAMGMPSIGAVSATMGKDAAELIVKDTIVPAIETGAKKLGLTSVVKFFTSQVVENLINAFTDPGSIIAKAIDENDLIPNNGYIELT